MRPLRPGEAEVIRRRHRLGASIYLLAAQHQLPRKAIRAVLREHEAGQAPRGALAETKR